MTTQERADFWLQQSQPGLTRASPAVPVDLGTEVPLSGPMKKYASYDSGLFNSKNKYGRKQKSRSKAGFFEFGAS